MCGDASRSFLTHRARQTQTVICVNADKSKEYRNDENLIKLQMSGCNIRSVDAWCP